MTVPWPSLPRLQWPGTSPFPVYRWGPATTSPWISGLDRSHPLQSLDAALDGSERLIDVGIVAGQVFLNNVSFGLYPQAIADPEYRSHRARSMADAAVDTVSHLETEITLTLPDGRVVSDIEVLLISNNPYRFIGPPDFARRPALDTGTLGIILADRRSRLATRACRIHPLGERQAHRPLRPRRNPSRS